MSLCLRNVLFYLPIFYTPPVLFARGFSAFSRWTLGQHLGQNMRNYGTYSQSIQKTQNIAEIGPIGIGSPGGFLNGTGRPTGRCGNFGASRPNWVIRQETFFPLHSLFPGGAPLLAWSGMKWDSALLSGDNSGKLLLNLGKPDALEAIPPPPFSLLHPGSGCACPGETHDPGHSQIRTLEPG